MNTVTQTEDQMYTFACPHCQGTVQVAASELHCRIFRHGVFKNDPHRTPIPPHASEQECTQWVQNNEILGCGKPFRLSPENPPQLVEMCGYI